MPRISQEQVPVAATIQTTASKAEYAKIVKNLDVMDLLNFSLLFLTRKSAVSIIGSVIVLRYPAGAATKGVSAGASFFIERETYG